MTVRIVAVSTLLSLLAPTAPARAADDHAIAAVRGLIARVTPAVADAFELELIPPENGTDDVFEVESTPSGKIVLRGNNAISLASAFNWYLKYTAHCQLTWSGEQLNVPNPPPPVKEKVHRSTPMKRRAYLNYCTFSYSMPWWDWPRWERAIDWMAMNGINTPLAIVGQEAVWQNTFKRFGMTDEQMREYLVGPAFLAWQFMGNLDHFGGPLPQSWIDGHVTLGRQILDRQRSFGMTPILQAFTGHTPKAYKDANPTIRIDQQGGWSDFPDGIYQMDPTEPAFKQLGTAFIEEQTKLFGTDHLYAADPFHEGEPPQKDPAYLQAVAKAVTDTMVAADPKAVWVMQTWSMRAPLTKAIPPERLLLLDIGGTRHTDFDNFWGRSFVSGTIQNFGGRTGLGSPLDASLKSNEVARTLPNCVGVGVFPEAIGNDPILAELMLDCVWRTKNPDMIEWVRQWSHRRYGHDLPAAARAWETLRTSVYASQRHDSMTAARPVLDVRVAWPKDSVMRFTYPPEKVWSALDDLLSCSDRLNGVDTYQWDLVDLTRQGLANIAIPLQREIVRQYRAGDREGMNASAKQFLDLLDDMDRLLGTRREFMLGAWIADARKWGTNDAEKDQYESNARLQVSIWGPLRGGYLLDYAWHEWNGLVGTYYKPRWQQFFAMLDRSLADGVPVKDPPKTMFGRPPFKANAFYSAMADFELNWHKRREPLADRPTGEPVATARQLIAKWRTVSEQQQAKDWVIGTWSPREITTSFKPHTWDVTPRVKKAGTYHVVLQYTDGVHRLDCDSVVLLMNGKEVARDAHPGRTGKDDVENVYRLTLSSFDPDARYAVRANIRSDGGTDSAGMVTLTAE